jgi:hypothetical protein
MPKKTPLILIDPCGGPASDKDFSLNQVVAVQTSCEDEGEYERKRKASRHNSILNPRSRVLNRIVLHSREGHSRIVKEKGNSLV